MIAETKRFARTRNVLWSGACALALASCGGDDGGGTVTPPAPTPISISSGATATLAENGTGTVYQVTTAGGSGGITYTLSGADAALFAISATGALTFRTPPDFETPNSAARSNTYTVTVVAADATGQATREVTVTVTNVADFTTAVQINAAYSGANHIAPVPGDGRLFVTERDGLVFLVDPAVTNTRGTQYLSITDASTFSGRRGLMAVAAAPDFATSGVLYAYVQTLTALEVRRYTRTAAGVGDPASADVILRVPFDAAAPGGGWLGFGPDNFLYLTTGNARTDQTSASLLGKVLRIDPATDAFPTDPLRDYAIPASNPFATAGGAAEVYAAGFTDPARAGIDGTNLYVSDVVANGTQSGFSRVYLVRAADAGRTFSPTGSDGTTPPVLRTQLQSFVSGIIVGGNVYRGPSPDLVGRYVFQISGPVPPDQFTGGIYSISAAALVQGTTQQTPACCTLFSGSSSVVSFGEDSARNLYYTNGTSLVAIVYR